ncbi:hypothetical protein L614_000200003180 [Ochrobactrum sp. J50]|uniref:YfhO family protein n=1 Tax=Ochrobactrum sp. J50 TaxID=936132 RepID=UPI0011A01B78|nr:YfhO family protein [Ochrobactrum sp. J50]TWH02334.1 hypothetical protein L614_000200003180 [Ochrobactrum sp. J50]
MTSKNNFSFSFWAPSKLFLSGLIPSIFLLASIYLVLSARGAPNNDYWSMVEPLLKGLRDGLSIKDFYVTSNEHIVAAANVVYLANLALLNGDNIGLSITTCVFSFIVCLLIAHKLINTSESFLEGAPLSLIAALFIFTPLAAHNFFLGMSGVPWIGANLFMVLSVLMYSRAEKYGGGWRYIFAILIAFLASQFYSTGIVALCAIGVQGIFGSRNRRLGWIVFILGLAYIGVISLVQVVPTGHGPRTYAPLQLAHFIFMFIGGGVSTSPQVALIVGGVGVVAACIVLSILLFLPNLVTPQTPFWVSFIAYSGIISGMAAIGRSSLGGELSSRYATIPSFFWLGLFGVVLCSIGPRTIYRRIWTALFLVVSVISFTNGSSRIENELQRADEKRFATLAFVLGVNDPSILQYVTSVPAQFYAIREELIRVGHVPYDGRFAECPVIGDELLSIAPSGAVLGHMDKLKPTTDQQWLQVNGWAASQENLKPALRKPNGILSEYSCMALADEKGTVVGVGLGGDRRPDVGKALKQDDVDYGWRGFIKRSELSMQNGERLFAVINTGSSWVKLAHSIEVGSQD